MPNNTQTDQHVTNNGEDNSNQLEPHQAEDLSRDDDLCSYLLVDQIGCDKLDKPSLGVHPQQAKFVGPAIEKSDVLNIIKHVVKGKSIAEGVIKVTKLPVVQAHLAAKHNKKRSDGAIEHVRLYLQIYEPKSRVEIWRTDRYTQVTGHTELGVYATSNVPAFTVLSEIQGRCANLPDEWREEMDEEHSDDDSDEDRPVRAVRRSGRTGRRDFSIIVSNRSRQTQLFLGPARFINHDCQPNVELTVNDKGRVTFRTMRNIWIGEELTTSYGEHYFDKNNSSCMCLTCEKTSNGWYSREKKALRALAKGLSTLDTRSGHASEEEDYEDDASVFESRITRRMSVSECDSPAMNSEYPATEFDSAMGDSPCRARPFRAVRKNAQILNFSKRHHKKTQMIPHRAPVDDPQDENVKRCITCVDPINPPIYRAETGYDIYCPRCTRHALIWARPWPAHMEDDVKRFPPEHLVPINFSPPAIDRSTLPTLEKRKKGDVAPSTAIPAIPDSSLPAPTKIERAQIKLMKEIRDEDTLLENERLRGAEWEEEREEAMRKAAEARELKKLQRAEAKRKREAGTVKGTGLWSRYELVDRAEQERRIAASRTVVSGTRSGRRFAAEADDAEVLRKTQEALLEELRKEERERQKAREWRNKNKKRYNGGNETDEEGEDANEDEDEEEEGEEIVVTVGNDREEEIVVAGPSRTTAGPVSISRTVVAPESIRRTPSSVLGAPRRGHTAESPLVARDHNRTPSRSHKVSTPEAGVVVIDITSTDSEDDPVIFEPRSAARRTAKVTPRFRLPAETPRSRASLPSRSPLQQRLPSRLSTTPKQTPTTKHVVSTPSTVTASGGSDAPRRRGRPPGSGHKQKLAARKREREEEEARRNARAAARERLEVESNQRPIIVDEKYGRSVLNPASKVNTIKFVSSKAINERTSSKGLSPSANSVDEASPPSAHQDENDSHGSFSSGELEFEPTKSSSLANGKRKRASEEHTRPKAKRVRKFFESRLDFLATDTERLQPTDVWGPN